MIFEVSKSVIMILVSVITTLLSIESHAIARYIQYKFNVKLYKNTFILVAIAIQELYVLGKVSYSYGYGRSYSTTSAGFFIFNMFFVFCCTLYLISDYVRFIHSVKFKWYYLLVLPLILIIYGLIVKI